MFENLMKKIANNEYKNIQEGTREFNKKYKMGLLTYTEKEDLIASIIWEYRIGRTTTVVY